MIKSLYFLLLLSHHSFSSQLPHQAAHNHCSQFLPSISSHLSWISLSLSTPIKPTCTATYFSTALPFYFSFPSQLGFSPEPPAAPPGRVSGCSSCSVRALFSAPAAPSPRPAGLGWAGLSHPAPVRASYSPRSPRRSPRSRSPTARSCRSTARGRRAGCPQLRGERGPRYRERHRPPVPARSSR